MEERFVSNQNLTEGREEKKVFTEFVKEHKKAIVIGAVTVFTVVVGLVIFKNRMAIKAALSTFNTKVAVTKSLKIPMDVLPVSPEVVEACTAEVLPSCRTINVREHLRNLPGGWNASQSKVNLAAQYGVTLGEHQTLVNSYTKVAA